VEDVVWKDTQAQNLLPKFVCNTLKMVLKVNENRKKRKTASL